MASRSSPRKNASRNSGKLLERILTDGARIKRDPESAAAAGDLVKQGIVRVRARDYVQCANPRDGDYRYARNRNCRGRIYPDEDAADGGDGTLCPSCDRRVHAWGKQRWTELQCRTDPEGIKRWLETALRRAKLAFHELAPWFYRITCQAGEAHLCVVDYCAERAKMTREWAVAQENRVVWLSVHPRGKRERTLPEQWLRCVSLVEVLSGEADLAAILREQAGVERPRSSGNAALPIYTKARRYPPVYEPVAPAHPGRLFAVELRASEVRVNGLVVIPSNARTGRQIFKALYSSFLADLESGKQPDAFQALNAEALCRVFYDETGEGEADPDVVRKTVNRIQAKIEKIIKRETGMPIGRHDVIQTQRWKGIGEGEHGYRLNPNSVAIRPDQSQESAT